MTIVMITMLTMVELLMTTMMVMTFYGKKKKKFYENDFYEFKFYENNFKELNILFSSHVSVEKQQSVEKNKHLHSWSPILKKKPHK